MKALTVKLFYLIVLMCITIFAKAQDKEENPYKLKGLQYGFNFGVCFPSNKPANYYNGDPRNTLSLKRAIVDTFYSQGSYSYYNLVHKEIRERVFNGDDFAIKELPQKMRYSLATNIGFYTKYNINDNWGIQLEFNYSKLKAEDKFSLERLNMPPGSIVVPYFYNLLAYESRVDINLGVTRSFGIPGIFKPYLEAAINLNNTNVKSADALIGDRKYSYMNQYNEQYNIRDDGIGNGYLLGGGLQTIISPTIILHSGINFSMKKVHLGDNKNYNLNTLIYIRLLFRQLITTKEEA